MEEYVNGLVDMNGDGNVDLTDAVLTCMLWKDLFGDESEPKDDEH